MSRSLAEIYKSVLECSSGLPGCCFTSEKTFKSEFRHLLAANWACVGLAQDVEEIGDVHPITFAGQPLLLTKAKDGVIRTFHNICRHRGTVLCDRARKNKKQITCPYHAWSYALDGTLLRTPHVGGLKRHNCESLDVQNLNLVEVPTETWGPFVFVNFRGNAGSLAERMRSIEERLSFVDFSLLRTGSDYSFTFDIHTNWKLAVENFVESYHVPMIHPELQRVNPMGQHYQILGGDAYVGQGGRSDGVADQIDPPLPIFPESANVKNYEALYVFPNLMITCLPNLLKAIIINPMAPSHTQERLAVFFVGDDAMDSRLDESRHTVMQDWSINVNVQDIGIIEQMQKGRSSLAFDGGRFAPKQEATSLHFQKLVAKRMLEVLEPTYRPPEELPVVNIYHDA